MDFFDPQRYFRQLDARRSEAGSAGSCHDLSDWTTPAGLPAPAIAAMARMLRQAREHVGLSQRELGRRAGVPQSHISKIESGHVDLRLSSLMEIARALRLEVRLVPDRAATERADPFDVQPLRGRAFGE